VPASITLDLSSVGDGADDDDIEDVESRDAGLDEGADVGSYEGIDVL